MADTRRFCMCCMLFNIRFCYKGHYFIYHFLWQIVILKFACIIFYAKIAYSASLVMLFDKISDTRNSFIDFVQRCGIGAADFLRIHRKLYGE